MSRILVIDQDRGLNQALALSCLDHGIAIRLAETIGEGVRYLAEAPVAAILVDAGLIRLSAAQQARVFDSVAPDVPVVVMVKPNAPLEEHVRFELEGFRVLAKPLDVTDLVAKLEPGRSRPRPGLSRLVS